MGVEVASMSKKRCFVRVSRKESKFVIGVS